MLWYDMLFAILLVAYMFLGYLVGFLKPIAGLIGIFLATFIAGQYYLSFGLFFIQSRPEMTQDVAKIFGFIAAWLVTFLVYSLITMLIINAITKNSSVKQIDKWLGLGLNFLKGAFMIALVFWLVETYTPESWTEVKTDMQTKSLLYSVFKPAVPAVGNTVMSITNIDWSQPINIPNTLQNKTDEELKKQGLQ